MNHLPLWYLGQLSPEQCDQAVQDYEGLDVNEATMGVDGEEKNKVNRDTKIRFAPPGYWLRTILEQHAMEGNRACRWEYHITETEQVQLAEYQENQHYSWHTDTFMLCGKPLDRKITVVALLNDEFEGGEFDVRLYREYQAPLGKGSILAFPSMLEHRVRPVLSGIRRSATLWLSGPRFR